MFALRTKYRRIKVKNQAYPVPYLPQGTIREELMYQMIPRIC